MVNFPPLLRVILEMTRRVTDFAVDYDTRRRDSNRGARRKASTLDSTCSCDEDVAPVEERVTRGVNLLCMEIYSR